MLGLAWLAEQKTANLVVPTTRLYLDIFHFARITSIRYYRNFGCMDLLPAQSIAVTHYLVVH